MLLAVSRGAACAAALIVAVLVTAGWVATGTAQPPRTAPAEGLREKTPQVFALTDAKVVLAPGRVLESASIVVRDGVIVAVGANVSIPGDARVLPLAGRTIYPGLVDPYSTTELGEVQTGAPYWNGNIQPQRRVADEYQADESSQSKLREQGFVARLVAPDGGILRGHSAIVALVDQPTGQLVLRDNVAMHAKLTISRGSSGYPNSPMGAVALARQAMYDAIWYRDAWQAYAADHRLSRPEQNDALAALQPVIAGELPLFVESNNELYAMRADQFAREFSTQLVIIGSGDEYRRLDTLRATGRTFILPVDFPKPPNVATPESARNATLESLLHWDLAPENPARLVKAGVDVVLTAHGLENVKDFLPAVRKAVRRGLTAEQALHAMTLGPARLLGVDDVLGTIETGKLASFFVVDGDLFDDDVKIEQTWVSGQSFEFETPPTVQVAGTWQLETGNGNWQLKLKGESKLSGTIAADQADTNKVVERETEEEAAEDAAEAKLIKVSLKDSRLAAVFDAAVFGSEGIAQLSAVALQPSAGDELQLRGQMVWPDGSRQPFSGRRISKEVAGDDGDAADSNADDSNADDSDADDARDDDGEAGGKGTQESTSQEGEPVSRNKPSQRSTARTLASFPVNFPLGMYGQQQMPVPSPCVVFRRATVWTCGPAGILENADVLVKDGILVQVGQNLPTPEGAVEVDCAGKHISPGIIDCHSHMATDGGVNESGQVITAEVRIGDFINSNDINIYRQLAGGVTSSNILHGSANPIGGQNQVIKLRWGALPDAMKFAEAPAGIKFALGENVTRSNRRSDGPVRYPASRMGVEQLMRDAFQTAREYELRWRQWNHHHQGMPPRRDLELDALKDILLGERWIHCHSYRQDEILALIRTLDDFGVTIGTFQHILEGYKVADAMAEHGAMGSAFSDWWAYKFEVYDAIPYAGSLMHKAGVVVSYNSDDRELARHLNHEAAKAVKYGGVSPEEALKFVTLNPARQLRIDPYVGSLETGKHADLVVWSGSPLSTLSVCEQTWVDGCKYFDRQDDLQRRETGRDQHRQLVQKVLQSGDAMLQPGERQRERSELWPQYDEFCRCKGLAR